MWLLWWLDVGSILLCGFGALLARESLGSAPTSMLLAGLGLAGIAYASRAFGAATSTPEGTSPRATTTRSQRSVQVAGSR